MVPRIVPAPPSPPKPLEAPSTLERLRAVVGPAGSQIADELVEAVRLELRREYERGYLEGQRKRRPVAPPESDAQRSRRHLERRLRHGAHNWMLSTRQLRKTIVNLILVLVMTVVGVEVSLHLASTSGKKLMSTSAKK